MPEKLKRKTAKKKNLLREYLYSPPAGQALLFSQLTANETGKD